MAAHLLRALLAALAGASILSCGGRETERTRPDAGTRAVAPPRAAVSARATDAGAARSAAERAPVAGARVTIPAGTVLAGSAPGTKPREPAREADGQPVSLAQFEIDALPYPNDPAAPPRTHATRSEAAQACAARDGRLCSELEWERACEGDTHGQLPFAPADEATCLREPQRCRAPTGVLGLGMFGREWTESPARAGVGDSLKSAVVRGAAAGGSARAHRCDARDAATPESRSETLVFRCCYGEAPDASYPDEAPEAPVAANTVSKDEARALLAAMPETRGLAKDFVPFSDADVQRALASLRASRTSLAPWRPVAGLVSWSPVPRERVRLLAGDSPAGAALVVFYPDVAGSPKFITSYETRGEHAPIVVTARTDEFKELLFSTCWGCGGEGGALLFDSDGAVRIELR
jgi:hypothetical protein